MQKTEKFAMGFVTSDGTELADMFSKSRVEIFGIGAELAERGDCLVNSRHWKILFCWMKEKGGRQREKGSHCRPPQRDYCHGQQWRR
jgi:hypothetical protein